MFQNNYNPSQSTGSDSNMLNIIKLRFRNYSKMGKICFNNRSSILRVNIVEKRTIITIKTPTKALLCMLYLYKIQYLSAPFSAYTLWGIFRGTAKLPLHHKSKLSGSERININKFITCSLIFIIIKDQVKKYT